MAEGRTFICSWKRVGDRYRVWVKGRPRVAAEATDFADADEALWGEICSATGDGENLREYDPPRPGVAEEVLLGRLAHVVASGTGQLLNATELFDGGICPDCKRGVGARTDVPMALQAIKGGDVGYSKVGTGFPKAGPRIRFYSDAFLRLLTATERRRFTWRPVERRGRAARKLYYELTASSLHVPVRLLVEGMDARHCKACGQERGRIYGGRDDYPRWLLRTVDFRYELLPSYFVSSADLPAPLPSCLTVGSSDRRDLCFLPRRWRSVMGRPGAKGLSTSDVAIVAPERVAL